MKKQIQIKVTGKVQGVFYRKYAYQKATELGITGFVKNMPDDSVYIEAYGDDDVLSIFVDWCYTGSPKSKVENMKTAEMEINPGFTDFDMF